jgi:hypothetical protein
LGSSQEYLRFWQKEKTAMSKKLTFAALMSRLARQDPLTPNYIREQMHENGFLAWSTTALMKQLLESSRDHRKKNQLGRLRAALLTGTTVLGPSFITRAERQGLLLTDDMPLSSFGQFLDNLYAEINLINDPSWTELTRRLETYRAYWRFTVATSPAEEAAMTILRSKPRFIIKRVLALAHLCFLRHYLQFETAPQLAKLFDELGTPEEVSSIASLLVAAANNFAPLDAFELGLPVVDLMNSDLHDIMRNGKMLVERFEIAKQISLFAYSLEFSVSHRKHIFCLQPPYPEFEYALRLGFIRFQLGQGKLASANDERDPQVSLRSFAEIFASKLPSRFCEIRDQGTEFRRIRLHLPLGPLPYKAIADTFFFEDAVEQEQLSQEFLLPVHRDSDPEPRLTENLDVRAFLRMWRHWQFLGLVDVSVTRRFVGKDSTIVFNSLVRVLPEEALIEMTRSIGIGEQEAREFVRLVTADVRTHRYFDLQYRPFLRMAKVKLSNQEKDPPSEILYLPGLVYLSNATRNVQSANQLRLKANASIFVDIVARVLKTRFKKVVTNRRVSDDSGATDIDVIVFENERLYLLECKHSIPPTGPHEIREIWEQIEKGTHQLHTALRVLADPERLQSYIAGWFPGTKAYETKAIVKRSCVLCSHRIFSGMSHNQISVRDFASLSKVVSDGVVGMTALYPDGDPIKYSFRITGENGFSCDDFDDYLSENSRYFKLISAFMHPVSRFERLGDVTIARQTYVFDAELHDWIEYAESLGFVRLPDERVRLSSPLSPEELSRMFQSSEEEMSGSV